MRKTREIEEETDRKLAAIIDGVQTLSRSVALPPKLAQLLEDQAAFRVSVLLRLL